MVELAGGVPFCAPVSVVGVVPVVTVPPIVAVGLAVIVLGVVGAVMPPAVVGDGLLDAAGWLAGVVAQAAAMMVLMRITNASSRCLCCMLTHPPLLFSWNARDKPLPHHLNQYR
jgi:hypothetical protein